MHKIEWETLECWDASLIISVCVVLQTITLSNVFLKCKLRECTMCIHCLCNVYKSIVSPEQIIWPLFKKCAFIMSYIPGTILTPMFHFVMQLVFEDVPYNTCSGQSIRCKFACLKQFFTEMQYQMYQLIIPLCSNCDSFILLDHNLVYNSWV